MTLKWCSNNLELTVDRNDYYLFSNEVLWESKKNYFDFKRNLGKNTIIAKHHTFSTISRLFDPIAMFATVITKATIFI